MIAKHSIPLLLVCWLAGCADQQQPAAAPPVRLETAGVAPDANCDGLAVVLDQATNDKGHVDFDELKKHAPRLEAQLKRFAVTGPTATPALYATPADRLAYWYNARAAWALRLALDANCPQDLSPSRLEERGFPLDGRTMSLDAIDELLQKEFGWREAAAAPCIRAHRARLPREPFSPGAVQAEVPRRLNDFLADRERFVIDVTTQTILFPPAIWSQRQRIAGDYCREFRTEAATLNTALLPHVKGLAELRLQSAIGYAEAPEPREGPLACLRH